MINNWYMYYFKLCGIFILLNIGIGIQIIWRIVLKFLFFSGFKMKMNILK